MSDEKRTSGPAAASEGDRQALVRELRGVTPRLERIAKRFEFPAPPGLEEIKRKAHVLLLGNHSSGKSTLINAILGRKIQDTGVAPTDDGFTIIEYAAAEQAPMPGAKVVTTASLPYTGLEGYGHGLQSHLCLKFHTNPKLRDIVIIDSPGMIDDTAPRGNRTVRSYDFIEVVRWFARFADVVLMMFDPEKPGTTAETLEVLRTSLQGLDQKLCIVLNRVDECQDLPNFARVYGTVCWNLARTIERKDLPPIYPMYLPAAMRGGAPDGQGPAWLAECDPQRERVSALVHEAPQQREHNLVSEVLDYARRLHVHAVVCDQARRAVKWAFLRRVGRDAAAVAASVGLVLALWNGVSRVGLGTVSAALLLVGLGAAFLWFSQRQWLREKGVVERPNALFEEAFAMELRKVESRDTVRDVWNHVRLRTAAILELWSGLPATASMQGGAGAAEALPAPARRGMKLALGRRERAWLEALMSRDLPALHAKVARPDGSR